MRKLPRTLVAVIVAAAAALTAPVAAAAAGPLTKVLVFSKTAGFRHPAITAGITAIRQLGTANGFTVTATEDATQFTTANLAQYQAVVWLNTTGDVLDAAQQIAFESYIAAGGGYAGVHAAADTEYDWPFYGDLVGAYFSSHPAIQTATIKVEDRGNASTAHLPQSWTRSDEWYNYRTNPRTRVKVLASLAESSYTGGSMGADHPITWCQSYGGGRSWYTGLGHTDESYADPDFTRMLLGGIQIAAGARPADCRPETGYTAIFDGSRTSLDQWRQIGAGSFTLADGTLSSVGGMGLLWYPAATFADYSLKVDWMMPGDDNGGVFIGFPDPQGDPWNPVNQGHEIQIDATDADPSRTTGSVYSFQAPTTAREAALNPPGSWNTYEISVRGQRIEIWLNGTKVNDYVSVRTISTGYIGVQNDGAGLDISYRNIRVKEGTNVTRTGQVRALGKCADVNAGGTADGTKLQIWDCQNGNPNQVWTVGADGTARAFGKCMDVQAGGTANGTKVHLWTCNGTGAQQWVAGATGSLRNPQSGKCLDIPGSNTANGTGLQIYTCNGTGAQNWALP